MLKVIHGGIQSVVEDWPGREGYNGQGMGPSGAMDSVALQMGNLLLGNELGEAAIEITAGLFQCKFEEDAVIAITGAEMLPTLNGEAIPNWETIFVKKGDVLKFASYQDNAFRTYLNVAGGIDVPSYLGSKSTCLFGSYGGFEGRPLKPNDIVKFGKSNYKWNEKRKIRNKFRPVYEQEPVVKAIPGMNAAPDFATEKGMDYLFSHSFKVSLNANRSAVRLEELPDWFFARESGGVGGSHPSNIVDHAYNIRGGLNITGNTPSLLLGDGPTLGGFMCSLNVIFSELWKVGQLTPGSGSVKFQLTTPEEATKLRKEQREMFTEDIVISESEDAKMKIDVNVDMGESFGRYTLGNDEEVMKSVTSANVACGFHAGDPLVMEQTVIWAKENNVAVGAHTGLRDLQGFGRRQMDITPEELRSDTLYQLGALDAVLKVHGMKMQHVKPHGILYRMVSENEKYIDTFLDTIKEYNKDLYIMLPESSPAFQRGIEKGLKMSAEALIDLSYDDDGNWILERRKKARTPSEVAERAVSVSKDKKIAAMSGKMIDMSNAVTLCLHGDSPNAVETAKVVKKALMDNEVALTNLSDM